MKTKLVDNIMMLRFVKTIVAKKELYGAKKTNKNLVC